MNLGSNSIAQPHARLPATGDLQFNLGDLFQLANVNFPLDYQPPRQNYPPNQVREDVAPQRYQPRVIGRDGNEAGLGRAPLSHTRPKIFNYFPSLSQTRDGAGSSFLFPIRMPLKIPYLPCPGLGLGLGSLNYIHFK